MVSHQTSNSSAYSNDIATFNVCRTMASWISVASSNKTQSHQFRLQSSLALIGFGAVASSIFIENDGLYIYIGVFVLVSIIFIALRLDIYYLKQEYIWKEVVFHIDIKAIEIAKNGLNAHLQARRNINSPDQLYKHYSGKTEGLSIHDFTTKMLRRVGLVVAISIGLFAGMKIDPSDWKTWWDKFGVEANASPVNATKSEQGQPASQLPPKLQKLLQ